MVRFALVSIPSRARRVLSTSIITFFSSSPLAPHSTKYHKKTSKKLKIEENYGPIRPCVDSKSTIADSKSS